MATVFSISSRTTLLALCLCAPLTSAFAEGGGGGGGGDGGGGSDRWAQPQVFARPPVPAPGARPYAETTLPDGTRIRSTGLGLGNHRVTTTTPDGVRVSGNRPRRAFNKPNGNKTVFNRETGITSTYTMNPDGSRTGVHVDRWGNRSVSTSWPRN
jgi:hypothetical protein